MFATIMGLSGLTIAYEKAYHFFMFPYWIYEGLLFLDTVVFFTVLLIYLLKLLKYPEAVKQEFNHPVKSSFMATISISFLLVSIAYYGFAPPVSAAFWFIGTPLQLFFLFSIVVLWIEGKFHIKYISPAWFIPVVGNIIIPVVGVDVAPIYVSIFCFSIGIFFWVVLFTIIVYRMIFHEPMSQRLVPTFFILIAPPAVGYISYLRITSGSSDFTSQMLYFLALYFFLQIIFMARTFTKVNFYISWWAYTFPLDALTIATTLQFMIFRNSITKYGAIFLLGFTSIVIAVVSYKTLAAIKNSEICIPEEA